MSVEEIKKKKGEEENMAEIDTDSILILTKKRLGIQPEYKHFDADIIMAINSTYLTLNQLGVGPPEGFSISDESSTWEDYISNNPLLLNAVKEYIYMKVKLQFDPPTSTVAVQSLKEMIKETECRINYFVDPKE